METSVSERSELRVCAFVLMNLSSVCGVRNWSLMALVLFVNKISKSSTVRVDEGGGGGGQRREEKVLKSVRESEQLQILLWWYVVLAVETFVEKEERSDTKISRDFFICANSSLQPEFRVIFTENIG